MASKSTKGTLEISRAIGRLEKQSAYSKWRNEQNIEEDDLLVVNNSFVFRDVPTRKSGLYVGARYGKSGKLKKPPIIVQSEKEQKSDFRRISIHQTPPTLIQVDGEVSVQEKHLGRIMFALISEVADDWSAEAPIAHAPFQRVVRNPRASQDVVVAENEIVVSRTDDEVALWSKVEAQCAGLGIGASDSLKSTFAGALDTLQGLATATLRLPPKEKPGTKGVTDTIVRALKQHRSAYHSALKKYRGAKADASKRMHFNEILRVAYSFSNEACTLLRLIVSLCDVKPLVLWSTIDRHFALSEALRGLPWTRSKNKPDLRNYITSVGDARNRAFHNVFPFEKALHFPLPPDALGGAELRIFSEFGSKAHGNDLTYDDKELVEVMMQFKRARARPTPDSFWEKNADVMDKMIDLFDATSKCLKRLYSTQIMSNSA